MKNNDEKILSALIATKTISAAAVAAGVSERTIYSRLADDDFRAEYERRQSMTLALVESLKELEETGVDDPENSAWSKLVNQLLTDIPALGDKIPDATAALEEGSEAIEAYIQEWRALQLETGRTNFLNEYYNLLGEKQAAYAKEQAEYEMFAIEAEARKGLYSQTWTNALMASSDIQY